MRVPFEDCAQLLTACRYRDPSRHGPHHVAAPDRTKSLPLNPNFLDQFLEIEAYVRKSGIDKTLLELIKVRASQMDVRMGVEKLFWGASRTRLRRSSRINRRDHDLASLRSTCSDTSFPSRRSIKSTTDWPRRRLCSVASSKNDGSRGLRNRI